MLKVRRWVRIRKVGQAVSRDSQHGASRVFISRIEFLSCARQRSVLDPRPIFKPQIPDSRKLTGVVGCRNSWSGLGGNFVPEIVLIRNAAERSAGVGRGRRDFDRLRHSGRLCTGLESVSHRPYDSIKARVKAIIP